MPDRRGSVLCILLAIALLLGFQGGAASGDSPERPNVVVILADDLGYGDLSPYGGPIEVPHLERLADGGLRFTDFHSSGTVCSPTRAGLLTGRYQQRAGIPWVVYADPAQEAHYHGLQESEVTLAERLRAEGYRTALFGKWHLGYRPEYRPTRHGFDRFRGFLSGNVDYFSHVDQAGNRDWWNGTRLIREEGYVTELLTEHATDFIKRNRNRPFFLYLAHAAPHYPFQGPGDSYDRMPGGDFPVRGSRSDRAAAYREMVRALDQSVGRVIEVLQRRGIARNTLVFFLSDNGASQGSNAPFRGRKGQVWEGGHRVPAVAWWPGHIEGGRTADQLASSLDLYPTILDAAGIDPPANRVLDGVSLLPLLRGEETEWSPRATVWTSPDQWAIRRGDWKLVQGPEGFVGADSIGLFNLEKDPEETTNLAEDRPDLVDELLGRYRAWKSEMDRTATPQPDRAETY